MLTAVQGTYENGQIILDEVPPVQERAKVIVTFLEPAIIALKKPRKAGSPAGRGIQFGSLMGRVGLPPDFNDPLDDLSEYM